MCVECPKWKKKNLWQTNCGNAIVEIGKKKFVTIVAMTLPKMGEKKSGSEIKGGVKKKIVTFTIFSQ